MSGQNAPKHRPATLLTPLIGALGIVAWGPISGGNTPSGAGSALFAAEAVQFRRDVQPILANHCWSCHGADEEARQAGRRLDRRDDAIKVGEAGLAAIVPGSPDQSELARRIRAEDHDQMPPADAKRPLSEAQKETLLRWIEQGATYAEHWAFVPPVRPSTPSVSRPAWIRNPIDAFVLARMERERLAPAPEAERGTWLRRVTWDLTGLPPTSGELADFLADDSPGAYELVVQRLLASPRHAERMAMLWLDAARYADTNGYNNDEERPMWPWRDWVIGAFSSSMPYDQFITEQLAGDLLPLPSTAQRIATGFNRNHVLTTEGGVIEEEYRCEYVADRIHAVATTLLGLSMQCARCHDHKYDPIAQREYYQFGAFFSNIADRLLPEGQARMAEPLMKAPSPAQETELIRLRAERHALQKELVQRAAEVDGEITAWEAALTPAERRKIDAPGVTTLLNKPASERNDTERAALRDFYLHGFDPPYRALFTQHAAAVAAIEKLEAAIPLAMIMAEMDPPRKNYVLRRGQYDQRGDEVSADVPRALLAFPEGAPRNRLGLARWLLDPQHPLTARVAVNRWWEMFFGVGLVETSEDFGVQGAQPTHPELLDWLATELMRSGWNQRHMLQLISLSAAYRQDSSIRPEALERDPRNLLLSRGPRHRLPAEMIRDGALAVGGLLAEDVGGPSVRPYQPPGLWEDVSVLRRETYVPDVGAGRLRRSMYTFWKRTCPPPAMATFDAPDRETCIVRRARTNTPLQALVLLNDPTYVEAGRKTAERVLTGTQEVDARFQDAARRVLTRELTPAELAHWKTLLDQSLHHFRRNPQGAEGLVGVGAAPRAPALDPVELAAWTALMNLMMNLDEAISKT